MKTPSQWGLESVGEKKPAVVFPLPECPVVEPKLCPCYPVKNLGTYSGILPSLGEELSFQ